MKKLINQNDKLNEELINTIEANFVFDKKPINRFSEVKKESDINQRNKQDNKLELREYGVGAQILKNLGIKKIILLSNSNKKIIALDGFDIEIEKQQKI